MLENACILIPLIVIAICVIVVGLVIFFLGTIEYLLGKNYKPTAVAPPVPTDATARQLQRLEEVAVLERNNRIVKDNK